MWQVAFGGGVMNQADTVPTFMELGRGHFRIRVGEGLCRRNGVVKCTLPLTGQKGTWLPPSQVCSWRLMKRHVGAGAATATDASLLSHSPAL